MLLCKKHITAVGSNYCCDIVSDILFVIPVRRHCETSSLPQFIIKKIIGPHQQYFCSTRST